MKYVKSILAVVIILISIASSYYAIDTHLAKASDVEKIEVKLDLYILSQRAEQLQQRLWQIEDRYKCTVGEMPPEAREAYRRTKLEREDVLRKIDILQRKK